MTTKLKVLVRKHPDWWACPWVARVEGMESYCFVTAKTFDEIEGRLRWEYPHTTSDKELEFEIIEGEVNT